ncbi:MAG: protoporphyrinogen oxidase, partial [Acidobacteria bacterium]
MTRHVPALVVGGGISGLVCAHALQKAGIEVLLVEASPRTGGVIHSVVRDGFLLELGPQSFAGTAQLRSLCAELGIADQLLEAPPRAPRYVLVNGALQPVPLSP